MKPWLALPAQFAYHIAPYALKAHRLFSSRITYKWDSFDWKGLHFHNRLGTSGGVDKNGEHVEDWWHYGVGFQELGTVTPKPQTPNPGKIIGRENKRKVVWNKMGFPNGGVEGFISNISKVQRPYHTPLFVNIGKNRWTPNESAHEDYLECIEKLFSFADVFVVNISSPNTKGLRELLKSENLTSFLKPILAKNLEKSSSQNPKPLLLKLSPDQSEDELKSTLDTSAQLGVDGWVLTNTTAQLGISYDFPEGGGISGSPLQPLSASLLQMAVKHLGPAKKDFFLISSGGIMGPEEVQIRLEMGADLVQSYSALIFEGPHFFKTVANFNSNR